MSNVGSLPLFHYVSILTSLPFAVLIHIFKPLETENSMEKTEVAEVPLVLVMETDACLCRRWRCRAPGRFSFRTLGPLLTSWSLFIEVVQ